jgi:hypothetical protein
MDQATLQKIARLRRLAGQQGKHFDVMRFTSEPDYARATLGTMLDTEDEETLVVGMALMGAMFPASPAAASAPISVPATKPAPAEKPAVAPDNKYVGRLR